MALNGLKMGLLPRDTRDHTKNWRFRDEKTFSRCFLGGQFLRFVIAAQRSQIYLYLFTNHIFILGRSSFTLNNKLVELVLHEDVYLSTYDKLTHQTKK